MEYRTILESRWSRNLIKSKRTGILIVVIVLFLAQALAEPVEARGPQKEPSLSCVRYSIPPSVLEKPFSFAGRIVPLQRPDVQSRIVFQINFLLLDARSVLTDWLSDKNRYSWIFEEIFVKEGIPKDFIWLSPIISGANLKSQSRQAGVGWWSLEKVCSASEGVAMSEDTWHDDRMDLELSTRCFSHTIKDIRKELENSDWLITVAAYMLGRNTVKEAMKKWNTRDFWDLPLPEPAEELVARWIALKIIVSEKQYFGLDFKESHPFVFDQVAGIRLSKDLPVAVVARILNMPARELMELNPKLRPSSGIFPAEVKGTPVVHSISVPRGKGSLLLRELGKEGYIAVPPKS